MANAVIACMVAFAGRGLFGPAAEIATDIAEYSIGGARVRKLGEGSSIPMAGTTDRMR